MRPSTSAIRTFVLVCGWALVPPVEGVQSILSWNSRDGDIKTLYWPDGNRTDLWAHVVPHDSAGGLRPVTAFIFYVSYPGKSLVTAPSAVRLYMESDLGVAPLTPRRAVLTFILEDGQVLDLTVPDRTYHLHTAGNAETRGAMFGITIDLTPQEFLRIAVARQVKGNALGLEFSLTPANLRQLREFSRRLKLQ
jgi:hypothetical protein